MLTGCNCLIFAEVHYYIDLPVGRFFDWWQFVRFKVQLLVIICTLKT